MREGSSDSALYNKIQIGRVTLHLRSGMVWLAGCGQSHDGWCGIGIVLLLPSVTHPKAMHVSQLLPITWITQKALLFCARIRYSKHWLFILLLINFS